MRFMRVYTGDTNEMLQKLKHLRRSMSFMANSISLLIKLKNGSRCFKKAERAASINVALESLYQTKGAAPWFQCNSDVSMCELYAETRSHLETSWVWWQRCDKK